VSRAALKALFTSKDFAFHSQSFTYPSSNKTHKLTGISHYAPIDTINKLTNRLKPFDKIWVGTPPIPPNKRLWSFSYSLNTKLGGISTKEEIVKKFSKTVDYLEKSTPNIQFEVSSNLQIFQGFLDLYQCFIKNDLSNLQKIRKVKLQNILEREKGWLEKLIPSLKNTKNSQAIVVGVAHFPALREKLQKSGFTFKKEERII